MYPKLFKVPPIGGAAGFAQFLRMMGIPAPLFFAWVVAVLEFWGGIALILGLATRWLGLLFAIDMLVAIIRAKAARGGPLYGHGYHGVGVRLRLARPGPWP